MDRWLGTTPWLLVGLSVVGICVGFYGFLHEMNRLGKKQVTEQPAAGETFRNHALVAAGVAVVGLALAAGLPQSPENRWPALCGHGVGGGDGAWCRCRSSGGRCGRA